MELAGKRLAWRRPTVEKTCYPDKTGKIKNLSGGLNTDIYSTRSNSVFTISCFKVPKFLNLGFFLIS